MRIKEINVYKFNELSERAKEKALDNYRNNNDFPFLSDYLNEYLNELLRENKIKEISNQKLFYSLSYSQGDGVCFIGTFKWRNYKVFIKHIGNYYHSNSTDIEIFTRYNNYAKEEVYDEFKELYDKICDKIEKQGYEIIDSENSEEYIIQIFEYNDYEFLENGEVE